MYKTGTILFNNLLINIAFIYYFNLLPVIAYPCTPVPRLEIKGAEMT